MIYLSTGGNGTGKTAITLRDVRKQQLAEDRPVYYHGFEALEPLKEFGWLPFEPSKWQDLPDGSILIFDEAQNDMPVKRVGAVPDWINAIAQDRRKRGFDFWLCTPHPSFIDVNVRRLIAAPSWHRHMKRNFGGSLISVLKFDSPNLNCEKPGAGALGDVEMMALPKEVFPWYKSASLHTAKRKIPKQVFILVACALLVPVLIYFGISKVTEKAGSVIPAVKNASSATTVGGSPAGAVPVAEPDYFASYQERITGLPHTAPRYDEVQKPQSAPTPAACVSMGNKCKCYTNQGTILPTGADMCKQIVAGGYFDETMPLRRETEVRRGNPSWIANPPMLADLPPRTAAARDGEQIAAMRARNGAATQY